MTHVRDISIEILKYMIELRNKEGTVDIPNLVNILGSYGIKGDYQTISMAIEILKNKRLCEVTDMISAHQRHIKVTAAGYECYCDLKEECQEVKEKKLDGFAEKKGGQ